MLLHFFNLAFYSDLINGISLTLYVIYFYSAFQVDAKVCNVKGATPKV